MTSAADEKVRPLPRRTRLRLGDTIAGFIERLAAANHLSEPYLRGYLPPGGYNNAVNLERLAALSGRDPRVLTRVFTAPRCLHCANVLPPARAKKIGSLWCSARCRQAATALRQNPRTWGVAVKNIDADDQAAWPRCGQPITRSRTGRPSRWCSATCRKAAYDDRYRGERARHRHRYWQLVTTRTPPTP